MRFGVGMDPIHPPGEVLAHAKLAERLGYESFWVADSQFLMRDAFILMGLIAQQTDLIVGSGVTNPLTRHHSVIARAYSTLEELAPQRVILGIGAGDSAVKLLGKKPAAVCQFERIIADIRALLEGSPIDYGDGAPVHLRDAFPVPIYLSVTGPKMIRLAARSADGVLLGFLTDHDHVISAKRIIEDEATSVGRDLSRFRYVAWIPCCIDEDSRAAKEQVRVHVARHVLHTFPGSPNDEEGLVDTIRNAYDYREHMIPGARHAEEVPLEVAAKHALAGTPDEVADRLQELIKTGVDHVVIVPRGNKERILQMFAETVMPRFSLEEDGLPLITSR